MIRWKLIGTIIHWSVTVLTVLWLYFLTEWVTWMDAYLDVIAKAVELFIRRSII